MTLFFEASALVSVYLKEERSPVVVSLFREKVPIISRLSVTEVVSSIAAAYRARKLRLSQRVRLVSAFREDLPHLGIVEITPKISELATELLLKWPLRSSDAIQLATCMFLYEQNRGDLEFVCADHRVIAAAQGESVPVIQV